MRLGLFRPISWILAATRSLWLEVQRFRQRCARKRAQALIQRSELFDAAWYLAQNPDVAQSGIDPARHYLLHGWLEGRNPSPLFDGREYLSRHPELYGLGVNPLVHYLQIAWREDRIPPISRPHEAPDAAASPNGVLALTGLPESWRQGPSAESAAGTSAYKFGDAVLGYGTATTREIADLHRHVDWLLLLCGEDVPSVVTSQGGAGDRLPVPGSPRTAAPLEAFDILQFTASGSPRIEDAWYVGSRCLRVRLSAAGTDGQAAVVTGLQWDPIGKSHVLVEAMIGPTGMAFLDVHLMNPFLPILLVLTTPAGGIRASTIVPFPSLCRGGLHHGETLLAPDGPAGLEAVRLTSSRLVTGWTAAGSRASLDRIEVDLSGAIGGERIFATDLRAWLGRVLGISVCPGSEPQRSDAPGAAWLQAAIRVDATGLSAATGEGAHEPRVLRLTHDAIPTLHALFDASKPWTGLAPFILGRGMDGTPAWVIAPPSDEVSLEEYQPQLLGPFPRLLGPAHARAISPGSPRPAAIRFTNPMRLQAADLQAPFAPETPVDRILPHLSARHTQPARVTAVLDYGGDQERGTARLEALALQLETSWDQVFLMTDAEGEPAATAAVRRFFPRCGEVLVHDTQTPRHVRFNQAAAQANGDTLLVLGGDVLLHDRRVVAYLARLLATPRIASTACMLITGGMGATVEHLDVVGCGSLDSSRPRGQANCSTLRLVDSLAALPPSAWPIAANSTDLFLVRRRDWGDHGGFEPGPHGVDLLATRYWEKSLAAGRMHLVSTAMSATVAGPDGVHERPPQTATEEATSAMSVRRIVA